MGNSLREFPLGSFGDKALLRMDSPLKERIFEGVKHKLPFFFETVFGPIYCMNTQGLSSVFTLGLTNLAGVHGQPVQTDQRP